MEQAQDLGNARDFLGCLIGKTIVDITQMDEAEWMDGDMPYIMLMMDDGSYCKFYVMGTASFDAKTGEETDMQLGFMDEDGECQCGNCDDFDEDDED